MAASPEITYIYDKASRETCVQLCATSATVAQADFGYKNRDDVSSVTRYGDLAGSTVIGTTVYGYDNGARVTAITNKNSSAATISYYNYAYNGGDLVTTATSSTNTKNYTYDPTNQLLTDGTVTYTYDANGNKNMAGYATHTGNQITNDGVWTYTYDNAGDMIQKSKGTGLETWYYGYDNRNRLITARDTSNGTINTFTGTYTYDILDQRVESDTWTTTIPLAQTRTSYDNGQAWADLNTSNGVLTRYVYDPNGNLVARVDIGTGLRQVFTDRLGSVRDVTDTSGTVLDHIEYTSVGAISSETGSSFGGNYGFDGLYVSRNAAINFSLHRQFSTSADAWMQMDPSGFTAGDSNLYRSNGNDPTNETDPSGLQEQPFNPQFPGSSQPSRAQIILGNNPNVATSVVLLTPASAASLMGLLASPGGSGSLLAASEGGVYPRLVDSFSSLYILPTKEGKFSRDEFEKLINNGKLLYDPNKPIAGQNMIGALDHLRLDAGCIGCTHIAVIPSQQYLDELTTIYGKDIPGSGPALQMMKVPPQSVNGAQGPWLNFGDAAALKGVSPKLGPNDKYMIFAFIGGWKGGNKPGPNADGKVPKDSIEFTSPDGAVVPWDFSVYQPSTNLWVNANMSVAAAGGRDKQEFYVRPDVRPFTYKGKKYDAIIYFVVIVRAK